MQGTWYDAVVDLRDVRGFGLESIGEAAQQVVDERGACHRIDGADLLQVQAHDGERLALQDQFAQAPAEAAAVEHLRDRIEVLEVDRTLPRERSPGVG